MRRFLLFMLFLSLLAGGHAATPVDAGTMEARVLIMNTVVFAPDGSSYRMDDASGTLSWFPRDTRLQEVISLETEPQAAQTDQHITFSWDAPDQQETITVTSVVRTRNAIIPVREQVAFPLTEVPPEVAIYLDPGAITDQSREIQALAATLAMGKDDAYEVVYTLADWTTRNVDYSLASVGQPAIQKSSEVLESRYGKCDELTALFISMNRALGIPARFVAGYSYTNSDQFESNWGGHGWAEIWLPGQGWIPFDVTYGEYGYLDASHITLKVAPDAKETSIDYRSRGNDFQLQTEPLDITITPLRMTEGDSEDITITLRAPQDNVAFGSAVLILAEVENRRDYYVSTRLDLAKTTNTDLLSSTYENVLLKPGERKTVPFLVRIDDNLQRGYAYTFPFRVYSRLGPDARIDITSSENAPMFDASAFAEEIARYTESVDPASFSVTCERGLAYVGEETTHTCTLNGAGNARVCDERRCITASGQFPLMITNDHAGVFTRTYTATTNGETARFYVTSRAVTPTVLKADISAPSQTTPDDTIEVRLPLSSTGALPRNIDVTVTAHHAEAAQQLDDLSQPITLIFTLPGSALRPGENRITATVSYTDEMGTERSETFTTAIELTGATFGDRAMFWINDAGYWLEALFQ